MVTRLGYSLPLLWPYGKTDLRIFDSTEKQIDQHFPNKKNLLINTLWFGSQFDGCDWEIAM